MTSDESVRRNCQSRTAFKHHDYRRNIQLLHNGSIKIIKDFAYFGSVHANGGCSQQMKRRLRLERAATEELEKIKSKDRSLETKPKTIPTLVFPSTMCACRSRTAKKLIGKKLIHLKYGVGKELYGYPGPTER